MSTIKVFQFFLRCEVRSVIILGISSNIFVNLSNLLLSAQENAFVSWPLKVRSELVLVISESHFRNHSNLFVMSILGTVLRILVMTLFSIIKVYLFCPLWVRSVLRFWESQIPFSWITVIYHFVHKKMLLFWSHWKVSSLLV